MAPSWGERIRRWFHADPQPSGSFDPARFERLCLENPAAAHAALMADQRELADELERTYAAYEERLNDLAARLSMLSPEDIRREARVLREAQDGMRRTLRRIDVSARSAKDLERELQEWEHRREESGPPHADHPLVRAEIIRSELMARGGLSRVSTIDPESSPFRVHDTVPLPVQDRMEAEDVSDVEEDDMDSIPSLAPDDLVGVIRMETREAERWHAIPEPDYEAIEQVRQVKTLHALLKRLDREQGINRDRVAFAIHMRETH